MKLCVGDLGALYTVGVNRLFQSYIEQILAVILSYKVCGKGVEEDDLWEGKVWNSE